MLTNCKDCQYFRGDSCLANPSYCEGFMFFDKQKKGMTQTQKDAMNAIAKPCDKFCKSDQLDIRSQEVSLTVRVWKHIAKSIEVSIEDGSSMYDDEEWLPLLEAAKKAVEKS